MWFCVAHFNYGKDVAEPIYTVVNSTLRGHNQGMLQDFFKGVADISSGGLENLPGGGKKIARYPIG